MILLIWGDNRTDGAILYAERPDIHPLAADAHAAIAQNAAWPIEIDNRGPLLFVAVILGLGEFRLGSTVGERHVLQFAFAARVADRAIQRMVAKQQFDHGLARLTYLIAVGRDDHAFGHARSAGGLKLRHLLYFYDAHTASALQREPGIVAKRGHLDARAFAGLDQQRARGSRDLFSIDSECDIRHF